MLIEVGNDIYINPSSVDAVYPDDRSLHVIVILKSGKMLSVYLSPEADRSVAIKQLVDKVNQGV